nr:hypothetical protein [uncultured Noviherbaspirillum sp.]
MDSSPDLEFISRGFSEIKEEEGGKFPNAYTAGCSGDRSACCTRTCSADQNFVASAEAWEDFLSIEGGEIQY